MPNNKLESLKEKVRQICTYYSDDPLGGTSGYSLSEDQFRRLFKLIEEAVLDERKRIVEVVSKFKDEDVIKKQVLNGRSYYQDLIDDILQKIKEMK